MIHAYLSPLISKFEAGRDPVRAAGSKKYLKNQYDFFGLTAPVFRAIIREHIREHGLPDWPKMDEITRNLWEMNKRECQHTAVELLNRMKRNLEPRDVPLLEYMILTKSWWDTVDGIAAWLIGDLFRRHSALMVPTCERWMASDNVWLQRTCLLFQLKYKEETDPDLLYGFIGQLSGHKSFWIRKAIGWSLREYSKTDPRAVEEYVRSHPGLSGLSKREALKVIHRSKQPSP